MIYIFNEKIIFIQQIIYKLFSFKELFIYLTDEPFLFIKLLVYSTNFLCIQWWNNNFLHV